MKDKLILPAAILILLCLFCPAKASAQQPELLTTDLASYRVGISAGFTGARVSVYGVRQGAGDIAIILSGPPRTMVTREKGRFLGVWRNVDSVTFREIPVYYDLAVTRPERLIASPGLLAENRIGLDSLPLLPAGRVPAAKLEHFREALIRNKQEQGFFPLQPKRVRFISDTFFRADFMLPSNVPTGTYTVTTLLIEQGAVLGTEQKRLEVVQVGENARISYYASYRRLAYGAFAVMLALVIGVCSFVFLRRN